MGLELVFWNADISKQELKLLCHNTCSIVQSLFRPPSLHVRAAGTATGTHEILALQAEA